MDDITINQLENKISVYARENKLLRENNEKLKSSLLNLENKCSQLKIGYNIISAKEPQYMNLEKLLTEKEKEILDLKEQICKLNIKFEKYKNNFDIIYEREINQMKYFNENNQIKIENSNKLEQLNKLFYYKILSLEETLKKFKEEEKRKLLERDIENEKKLNDVKKKMLSFIKEGGQKAKDFSIIQNNLNDKLNILHDKGLMSELEYQSYQIEDLLKQREHLDEIINNYKCDIKIHKKVEKILSEKNLKYTKFIQILSNKIDNINKINHSKSSDKNLSKNTINISKVSSKKKICEKKISLTKEIIDKNKKIEVLKMKYNTLKSKLDNIHFKFSNILNLLDMVLEKVYNDENFKNFNNIYVNIEELKKCDFEKLNNEQKYSLIVLVIKHMIPFLDNEGLSSKFKDTINNNQIKIFRQNSLETNFSKNDTFRNSNYFKRNRICLIKDFNKTGFNKMNSSFLNYNHNYSFNCPNLSFKESNTKSLKKSTSLFKLNKFFI